MRLEELVLRRAYADLAHLGQQRVERRLDVVVGSSQCVLEGAIQVVDLLERTVGHLELAFAQDPDEHDVPSRHAVGHEARGQACC